MTITRTEPAHRNLTDLRAVYDAAENTLAIVHNSNGEPIIEVSVPGSGTSTKRLDKAIYDLNCERLGEWWAPGYEHGQIGHEGGPEELDCYVNDVSPLFLLHAAYAGLRASNPSANDVEQFLDDYLVSRGFDTVLYA